MQVIHFVVSHDADSGEAIEAIGMYESESIASEHADAADADPSLEGAHHVLSLPLGVEVAMLPPDIRRCLGYMATRVPATATTNAVLH